MKKQATNRFTTYAIGGVVIILIALVFSLVKINAPKGQTATTTANKDLQAIYDKIPTQSGKNNFLKQSNNLTKKVDPELVDLDSQIITCGANVDGLLSQTPSFAGSCTAGAGTVPSTKGMFLGGQCCGALVNTTAYHENLKKLQAYKNMPDIVLDPMHTPITLAKKWIDYDNSTTLTPNEQKVYDAAYAISKEKPCCCKCWHYYTNEGIAKQMIKSGTYTSQQIADYWDASEVCGV